MRAELLRTNFAHGPPLHLLNFRATLDAQLDPPQSRNNDNRDDLITPNAATALKAGSSTWWADAPSMGAGPTRRSRRRAETASTNT
jgi:hypothetical protein